ncbi:unnamed protein product [Vicia faba]|uniref:Uncharacterized protein n=1 Tax=Vicia faba TaxID=3906 RepID=A0AAV1A810_VICFA|nr:unnamed protein product [Vicia faba]
MLITAKPTHLQPWWLPFPASTPLPKRTTFNTRRTILLNNNNDDTTTTNTASSYPPMLKKRIRYRKLHPGETTGITEEMRFVAMRLRNDKINNPVSTPAPTSTVEDGKEQLPETCHPSLEGFIRFLVDNQHVFATLERIIDDSDDVSYAYLRKTGLERSEGILKDLEWLKEEGVEIPNPSSRGITYAKYLEELAETSAPLFLSHFYNIHFSHITGGQVITKQVSERLLEGKELEFCKWEGDVQEMLKDVREKLNMLAEHWSRDEKNKILRETKKSFQFMGQIVRMIVL